MEDKEVMKAADTSEELEEPLHSVNSVIKFPFLRQEKRNLQPVVSLAPLIRASLQASWFFEQMPSLFLGALMRLNVLSHAVHFMYFFLTLTNCDRFVDLSQKKKKQLQTSSSSFGLD